MRKRQMLGSLAAAGSLLLSAAVLAESDPTDLIKYRKDVMSSLGGHAAAASLIIRGKVGYSDQLVEHARSLASTSTMIKDIFPPDSQFGDTGAKDAVWAKPEAFKKDAMDAQKAAADFLKAAESGDKAATGKAFMTLGRACKSCHDNFRKEKK